MTGLEIDVKCSEKGFDRIRIPQVFPAVKKMGHWFFEI